MVQAVDVVKFRIVWWFKYLGKGVTYSISSLLLNVKDLCVEQKKLKISKIIDWIPPPNDCMVKDFGSWQGSQWVWKVDLRRPLFDWEQDQWNMFTSFLDAIKLRRTIPNSLAWSHSSDGKFSVRSFRWKFEDHNTDNLVDSNLVWQGVCPPKVEIFIWQVLRGRVMVRKFNVDGSSKGNLGPADIGGVLRDSNGLRAGVSAFL
ncbi:hypothetical protein Dsin_022806 [Dipteronia sinensis]|uniref:Reverse transcriptase zinc-binding domain-containing protein n=1 Tax=Dipteronia sinensis TaxID=43782 RepID=A0AAE0E098_9ROSI|nr:hypothetical protein Dsin_022806 [Dipteronia sinensis]